MIDISMLKSISSVKHFSAGQIIICEGDEMSDEMFIILKGMVSVYKNYREPEEVKIDVFNQGDFFGEISLFLEKEQPETVVAEDEVFLLSVNRANVYDFLKNQPEAVYAIIKSLCRRLADITEAYEKFSLMEVPSVENNTGVNTTIKVCEFFPKGHKYYNFDIVPEDDSLLIEKNFECPICGFNFNALTVKAVRLKLNRMDRDFRQHHQGIDTSYFDTVSCPGCLYSNFVNSFGEGKFEDVDTIKELFEPYQMELSALINGERNIDWVFTCLYLALKCAPLCFIQPQLMIAKLWLRLSWLYQDCGDEDMELYAVEKAQQAHIEVYESVEIPPKQKQQLCLIIGWLSVRANDFARAKRFLHYAKTDENGSLAFSKQADEIFNEIKMF